MKNFKKIILDYIKETRAEVKKVTWPGRQYTVAATTIILLIVAAVSVFIMFLDWGLAEIFLFLNRAF